MNLCGACMGDRMRYFMRQQPDKTLPLISEVTGAPVAQLKAWIALSEAHLHSEYERGTAVQCIRVAPFYPPVSA